MEPTLMTLVKRMQLLRNNNWTLSARAWRIIKVETKDLWFEAII